MHRSMAFHGKSPAPSENRLTGFEPARSNRMPSEYFFRHHCLLCRALIICTLNRACPRWEPFIPEPRVPRATTFHGPTATSWGRAWSAWTPRSAASRPGSSFSPRKSETWWVCRKVAAPASWGSRPWLTGNRHKKLNWPGKGRFDQRSRISSQ